MSNVPVHHKHKETASIEYFKRSKLVAGLFSILALVIFLAAIFFTVPAFFSYFWLAPLLLLLLILTKSYGAWEAYTKMRQQTDILQEELDEINQTIEKITNEKQQN
jgi:hypothetical protein